MFLAAVLIDAFHAALENGIVIFNRIRADHLVAFTNP
jgi:hypothetical protein